MDLITYALAKKFQSSGGATDGAGILTKLESNVQEVQKEIKQIKSDVEPLLPLVAGAVLAIYRHR